MGRTVGRQDPAILEAKAPHHHTALGRHGEEVVVQLASYVRDPRQRGRRRRSSLPWHRRLREYPPGDPRAPSRGERPARAPRSPPATAGKPAPGSPRPPGHRTRAESSPANPCTAPPPHGPRPLPPRSGSQPETRCSNDCAAVATRSARSFTRPAPSRSCVADRAAAALRGHRRVRPGAGLLAMSAGAEGFPGQTRADGEIHPQHPRHQLESCDADRPPVDQASDLPDRDAGPRGKRPEAFSINQRSKCVSKSFDTI